MADAIGDMSAIWSSECDLKAGHDRCHLAEILRIGEHDVRHDARNGVRIPVEAQRYVGKLAASDDVVIVQVDVRVARRDLPRSDAALRGERLLRNRLTERAG